jgi:hypothetical protein
MGLGTLISLEEYQRNSYRPDCDFIEGSDARPDLAYFNLEMRALSRWPAIRPKEADANVPSDKIDAPQD